MCGNLHLQTLLICSNFQGATKSWICPEPFKKWCCKRVPRCSGSFNFKGRLTMAKNKNQVIQAVTFLSPIVGGHQQPLTGSLNHPKKVTKNCQEIRVLMLDMFFKWKPSPQNPSLASVGTTFLCNDFQVLCHCHPWKPKWVYTKVVFFVGCLVPIGTRVPVRIFSGLRFSGVFLKIWELNDPPNATLGD